MILRIDYCIKKYHRHPLSFTTSTLESVKVKPEMKVENVDVSTANSEVSPTLELDF